MKKFSEVFSFGHAAKAAYKLLFFIPGIIYTQVNSLFKTYL